MMKPKKSWRVRAAALVLAGLCLGGAALAAGGDQNDPLITLSYLTKTVTPDILEQVDQKAAEHQAKLLEQFNALLAQHSQGSGSQSQIGDSGSYQVVTLRKGQKLSLEVGCEVLLRVGSATVNANTAPALIDLSGGGTLNGGAALVTNHLYLATIADRSVTASADTVKLLVRGEYNIS